VDAGLDAQYTLSSMYKHGHGVQQNDHHATIWWRKANDTAKALGIHPKLINNFQRSFK
jgi:TPR repeat protein